MKNIFKFMGIALISCSLLMVSCGKDDENDTNDTTPVNPNPNPDPDPQPQPGTGSVAVTWDGAAQDIQYINAEIDNESLQNAEAYMIEVAKGINGNNLVFPAFYTYFLNGGADAFGHASEFTLNTQNGSVNGNAYYPTEAYIEGGIELGGDVYGDWQLQNRTINSENFDATTMAINANMDFVMYDFEDWAGQYNTIVAQYQAGTLTEEEANAAIDAIEITNTKNMKMVITNVVPE